MNIKKNEVIVVVKAGMLGVSKQIYKFDFMDGDNLIVKENKPRVRKQYIVRPDKDTLIFRQSEYNLLVERDIKIDEGDFTTFTSTGNYKLGFVNTPEEIKAQIIYNLNKRFKDKLYTVDINSREFKELVA